MITYNHEHYIAHAIESVLIQNTLFDYELVIGEDCSTDRTREILLQYQKNYPDKIKIFLNKENIGGHKNFLRTLSACTGDYIALLEGDDFWIDPNKLQKQVNFLDSHPDCSICFHKVIGVFENNPLKKNTYGPSKKIETITTIKDLLTENYLPTLSVMYRRDNIPPIPEALTKFWMLDWPLHILVAGTGDIGYLDEEMGVYRSHQNGICSRINPVQSNLEIIKMLDFFNSFFNYKYNRIILSTLSKYYYELSLIHIHLNDITTAKGYLKKTFEMDPYNSQISKFGIISLFIRIYFLSHLKPD